jgi:hypothetical protein
MEENDCAPGNTVDVSSASPGKNSAVSPVVGGAGLRECASSFDPEPVIL